MSQVAYDEIELSNGQKCRVSTVVVDDPIVQVIDFLTGEPEGPYETKVFPLDSYKEQDASHYATLEAALLGHLDMVKKWLAQ